MTLHPDVTWSQETVQFLSKGAWQLNVVDTSTWLLLTPRYPYFRLELWREENTAKWLQKQTCNVRCMIARCMRDHDDYITTRHYYLFLTVCSFFRLGRWRGACESMTTAWPTRYYLLFLTVRSMFRLRRWRGACESMTIAWPMRYYQLLLTVRSHVQARKVARCMREHDDCMTYETVAKEAPGGDSNSVEKNSKFLTYFHCSKRNLNLN